jgi:hypothetical protein
VEPRWGERDGQHVDVLTDGQLLATTSRDETLRLWRPGGDPTGSTVLKIGSVIPAIGWHGSLLAVAAGRSVVLFTVGDGSYIFGAPTAAHFVSRAYNLPALFVIFNNRTWNAVKRAVQTHARDGWAVKTDSMPLTALEPAPDYRWCAAPGRPRRALEDRPLPRRPRAGSASSRKRSASLPQRHLPEAVMKILATGPSGSPDSPSPATRDQIIIGRPSISRVAWHTRRISATWRGAST